MSSKILVLTKYASLGGSSRYRFYQYLPYLKSQGFDISVMPLLDNTYVTNVNHGKRSFVDILTRYFQHLYKLLTRDNYDLLWIEKEILPYLPMWLEKIVIRDIPYVVDYDDAQFHRYDRSKFTLVKMCLSRKIDTVMANSRLVIAGNKYIHERAQRAGAERIEIIPTVIDLERYSLKTDKHSEAFNIGWIGSPSTSRYLKSLQPVFQNLAEKHHCQLTLVGSGKLEMDRVNVQIKKWGEQSEVEDIKTFDVGIMPLHDTPWEQGKCGIKLIQYMACALPVIGTPIGVNQEIIHHGMNGFYANNLDEWQEALLTFVNDPQLCHQMGAKGRAIVESEYCLQITAPKLAKLLQSCL